MSLPFTTDQFLDVFRRYNDSVWPAQWVLLALAVLAVALAGYGRPTSGRQVGFILATLWLWMAVVYHLGFFMTINPAAPTFAVLFTAQALMFARLGASRDGLIFDIRPDTRGVLGILLVTYALAVYPALGIVFGHRYPETATIGLPCPTTILTLGLLTWAGPHVPRILFLVPLLWAAIGSSAALLLGMREDVGLLVAGAVGVWVVVRHGHAPTVHRPRPA
jgi:hypothetical protein